MTSNSSIGGDDPSQLRGFEAFEVIFSRGTGTWLEENTPQHGGHSGGEAIVVENDDVFFDGGFQVQFNTQEIQIQKSYLIQMILN